MLSDGPTRSGPISSVPAPNTDLAPVNVSADQTLGAETAAADQVEPTPEPAAPAANDPPLIAFPFDRPPQRPFARVAYEPFQQGHLGSVNVDGDAVRGEPHSGPIGDGAIGDDDAVATVVNATEKVKQASGVSLVRTANRAPFSEHGIAERLAQNPDFYRRLAEHVASELSREISSLNSQRPNGAARREVHDVITREVGRFKIGFEQVAAELAVVGQTDDQAVKARALQAAAQAIVKIRDGFAQWCEKHPTIATSFMELAAIGLASYALHQFAGATGDIAAFISYAVVRKEKLSDILSAGRSAKKTDKE